MPNLFKKLFKKKNKSVLGIDIGSSAIKVVQIREKLGRPQLETYGVLSLGPYAGEDIGRSASLSNEKLGGALSEILKEAKISTSSGGLAIPFSASLVSVIELPRVGEKELQSMVPIEARKYIPVPISEVTLDWSVIPEGEEGGKREEEKGGDPSMPQTLPTIDVLIAAIHNNTISKYQDVIQKASLDTNFFEIEVFSTVRSILGEAGENDPPVMIMDMGAASTKLYVIDKGVVMNSHTINRGSQDMSEAISKSLGITFKEAEKVKREEGVLSNKSVSEAVSVSSDYVFLESKRVAESYFKRFNKRIAKIILVGGGVTAEGFASMASANLEIPVVYGDPFSKIETPDYLKEILKYNGPEFAVAAGVALRKLEEL